MERIWNREAAAWAAVVALALLLRLWELTDRPFQYDEGQVAYFSWRFFEHGEYTYMPVLHGPVIYYLNALSFQLLGDSDFSARLVPVLAGIAIVLLPLGLRRQLGRAGALGAGALLAISPAFVYYSRFDREDIVLTCLELALLVVAVRLFDRPRPWHPAAIGALLAACFATKEATFITVAIVLTGLLGAQIAGWPLLRRLGDITREIGWRAWLGGIAAFGLVFSLLFGVFFTDPGGIVNGIWDGPKYWAGEHEVNRGSEEWPYYLVVLLAQEWLVLALGLAGAAFALARRDPLGFFLIWLFAASLAVYSYAGERFAWLALQPLLPLALLGGLGVEWLWSSRRRSWRALALAAAAAAAALFAWSAFDLSVNDGTDPRELAVVVYTDPDVLEVRDEVLELSRRDPAARVLLDTSDHGSFPWAWYFRNTPATYVDLLNSPTLPPADIVVSGEVPFVLHPRLSRYERRPFTERRFWDRDYGELTPAALWRWKTGGRVWGELGSVKRFLLVKRAP